MTEAERLGRMLDAELERRRLVEPDSGLSGAFGPAGDASLLQAYLYWYAAEAELVVNMGAVTWIEMPTQRACLDLSACLAEFGVERDPEATAMIFSGLVVQTGSAPELERAFEFSLGILRALSQCVCPGTEWPQMHEYAENAIRALREAERG